MSTYFSSFPSQKRTSAQKTKKWYKECIDAIDVSGYFNDEGVRASFSEKLINSNLYNGKLDPRDLQKVLNPTNISHKTISKDMTHYPIINPRIEVLVGEEFKRRFDYKAVVTNPEAVSEKSKELNSFIKQRLTEIIEANYSERQLEEEFEKLQEDISSYQDKRESLVNKLLKHYWRELKLDRLFNNGFKNCLIQGEEYYETIIVGGKPELRRINPLKTFWTKSGYSNKIQDSDLIIIDDYWSPGQILDHFNEYLTEKQLKEIDRGYGGYSNGDPFVDKTHRNNISVSVNILDDEEDSEIIENLINVGQNGGFNLSQTFDNAGNIRVLRVFWRGWRKVQEVTFFDEFGQPQVEIFPENYIPKKDEGETSKTIWINEWYEGTKIANDIYIKMQPKEIQFRSIENPAYSHPGIVGKAYSFDNFSTVSLLGRVKNYLYLYDAIHDRLNKLLALNQGKILEMDLAKIPANWDVDKWFHYVTKMKIAVTDSFKEGNKGQALGKLAGSMNNASKGYIDLDQASNIQQHIAYLEFIKREMTEITGVSDQRMGQISNRETVGGIERSVNQSSHITEWYFSEHEDVKIDALRAYIECIKYAYRNKKNHKMQYILDDMSIETLNVDPELIQEADYGILVTNSARSQEAEERIKTLAETALNAGVAQFEDIVDIYLADSLSDIKNNVKQSSRRAEKKQAEQFEQEQETRKQEAESKLQAEREKIEQEEIKNIRDNQTKLAIAQNKNLDSEIEKLEIERQKRKDELERFNKQLEEEKRQFDKNYSLDQKKLEVEKMKAQKQTTKSK